MMSIGFRVYVDESGDEGFQFGLPGAGSSHWFVLSAVVTRAASDLDTVKLVDRIRTVLNKSPKTPLHFRGLKHEHRLPYVDAIAKASLWTVSVMVHKPSIDEKEKFVSEAHLLYRYATRYLLERVSWLCRDRRDQPDEMAKIVFSNRSCMSYGDLRDYLGRLKSRTNEFGVHIDWTTLDPSGIEARTHDSLMGLQIADAVASSIYKACELTAEGFNEPRYAEMLSDVFYRHKGQCIGYGLKLWPRTVGECTEPHLKWLTRIK